MLKSWIACGIVLVATTGVAVGAEPAEIVRLWTAHRDAQSFDRMGVAGTDDEPGDPVVLRTQAGAREGFYFTIRVRGELPSEGRLLLHVVAPDAVRPQTFTFPLPAAGERSAQFLVGITGGDWTHGEVMPLAWRIEFQDRQGQVVVERESFLWRKP